MHQTSRGLIREGANGYVVAPTVYSIFQIQFTPTLALSKHAVLPSAWSFRLLKETSPAANNSYVDGCRRFLDTDL